MKLSTAPRLTALLSAAVLTLLMLGSVNRLATSAPTNAQLAQAGVLQRA